MSAELGPDWRDNFSSFDAIPFASASIGQVHRATLTPTFAKSHSIPYLDVAIKIQFPNIHTSIRSDLSNLALILHASSLLPKGLFLDKTLEAMQDELEDECDYEKEAEAARRFQSALKGDERFGVMSVVDALSTKRVLSCRGWRVCPSSKL